MDEQQGAFKAHPARIVVGPPPKPDRKPVAKEQQERPSEKTIEEKVSNG